MFISKLRMGVLLWGLILFPVLGRTQPALSSESPQSYTPKSQTIFPGLYGQQLIDSLVAHYKPATVLSYDEARDTLFGVIYNHNDSVTAVYTGYTIYLDPAQDPSDAAYAQDINTEHTWPQSKGATGMARSDMHHLCPSRTNVNSDRGNDPFAEIIDTETDRWYRLDEIRSTIPTQHIDEYSEKDFDASRFEPREDHKGNVARAMFYFYTMYKDQADAADPNFFPLQKNILRSWHHLDPADSLEIRRTNLIANYQDGKPNPFVLDSTLVDRAYFTSAPPTGIQPGDLVISEFMANPDAVSDSYGEYVEFYNTTDSTIDMNGLVLEDDDGQSHTIDNGAPLLVAAHDFVVLGINGDSTLNGGYPADYVYSDYYLSNSADEIVLKSGSTEVARLSYSDGDPYGAGVSLELRDVSLAVNGVTQQSDYIAASSSFGAGDLGSPGHPGNTLGTGEEVLLRLRVFLEGPYRSAGDSMSTYFTDYNGLPASQPFSGDPWNYTGSEAMNTFPDTTVDWLLVELRTGTAADTRVVRRAVLLTCRGTVLDTSGSVVIHLPQTSSGNYYVVVWHRNHLNVMSASAITLRSETSTLVDFTSSQTSAYSTNQPALKEMAPGRYGLFAGDANADGLINISDISEIWISQNGAPWNYSRTGDVNLDAAVDAIDSNGFIIPNAGKQSQVP